MNCYGCGSPEGNEARLCPACNDKRSNEHASRVQHLSRKTEDDPVPQLTYQQKVLLAVGAGLLIIGLAWLLTPASQTVESRSPMDDALKACVLRSLGAVSPESDPEALTQATSTCEAILQPCITTPDSQECVAAMSAASPVEK